MPPAVRLYGKTGTFQLLNGDTQLITEQTFDQVAWTGSDFRPSKCAGWATFADGKVFMAGLDTSNNPANPSGTEEVGTIFDPSGATIAHTLISTTTGATSVIGSNGVTGGAFMADAEAVLVGTETYVCMLAQFPYNGWNIGTNGIFKGLATFRKIAGTWQYDSTKSYTVQQLHDSSAAGAAAFPLKTNSFSETYAYDKGMADMAVTPQSRALVGCQYFNDGGTWGGGLVAIDPGTGTVLAFHRHPFVGGPGGLTQINPRSVVTDPTGKIGDERFVVLYDTTPHVDTNVMQEFSYNSVAQTITPVSSWMTSASGMRWGQAVIDSSGNLWVMEINNPALVAGGLCVFAARNSVRKTAVDYGASGSWWTVAPVSARPDIYLGMPSGTGYPWNGAIEDPPTKTVAFHTIKAEIMAFHREGSGANLSITRIPTAKLDYKVQIETPLGLGKLQPSNPAIDVTGRYVYWPIAQQDSAVTVPSYPAAPHVLDQWLYRLDADRLFALPAFVGSGSGTAIAQTSFSVTLPSTFEGGDFAILCAVIGNGAANTAPANTGWTELLNYYPIVNGRRYMVWTRQLVGGDANPTISYGTATNSVGALVVYRGCDPSGPILLADETFGNGVTSLARPQITPTRATRIIGFYGVYDGAGGNAPLTIAGELSRKELTSTNHPTVNVTEEEAILAAGTASTSRTASWTGAAQAAAITIALAPIPAIIPPSVDPEGVFAPTLSTLSVDQQANYLVAVEG